MSKHDEDPKCMDVVPGLYAYAPWLPIDEWRAWLTKESELYESRSIFLFRLGVRTRQLWRWLHDPKIGAVSLSVVERTLWYYFHETGILIEWDDIWSRDQLMDKHPGRRQQESDENDTNDKP